MIDNQNFNDTLNESSGFIVDKVLIRELIREIAEQYDICSDEEIQDVLGIEHPLSRLDNIFK